MTLDELVTVENASIRSFVEAVTFKGRVLDLGAGRQPYRKHVERTAVYVPWDRIGLPACMANTSVGPERPLAGKWDMILCTQVIQFIPCPLEWLNAIRAALVPGGLLVMTGPTNWPEVNETDLHRHTLAGATSLLHRAGFAIETLAARYYLPHDGFQLSLGWGAVAVRS